MIFLLSLIPIILIHEAGHLIIAKLCKCGVKTFSIGFGKAIWSKKIGETIYQIAPLLLGGYCELESELIYSRKKTAFTNKTFTQKVLISLAGVIFNLISGGLSLLLGWLFLNKFLFIFGLYSILIGLTNLLPFPSLDGSYPFFFLLEKKLGKKKTYEVMQKIFRVCFAFIMLLNILSIPLMIYYIYKGYLI